MRVRVRVGVRVRVRMRVRVRSMLKQTAEEATKSSSAQCTRRYRRRSMRFRSATAQICGPPGAPSPP